MANKKFFVGMLVIALVFGIMVVACDIDDNADSGLSGTTWVSDHETLIFNNNGTFENKVDGISYFKGNYSTSGSNISLKVTQINGAHPQFAAAGYESKWYTRADLKAFLGLSDAELDEELNQTGTYTLSGNKLTLTWQNGGTSIYTKSGN